MEKHIPAVCTRLKELRKSRNYTQGKLADLLGISKQSICNYENNMREPDMKILEKYCDYFEVSIDYLFGKRNHESEKIKMINSIHKDKNFMKTLDVFNSIEFKKFSKVIHELLGMPTKPKKKVR